MKFFNEYGRWLENANEDGIREELEGYSEQQIEDSFYCDLSFGTGGLRGLIGAGTNRMNVYTVAKASQGLADYLIDRYGDKASVAIGYDSRIKSKLFAQTAASVFAANGVDVHLCSVLRPVPALSYAVRYLGTSAGIMITASHNPSTYNGYKVYGSDGCQVTTRAAEEILAEIEKIDVFSDVKKNDFHEAVKSGMIKYIDESVFDSFINEVKNQSVLFGEKIDKDVSIVYSPLNGTGYIPVVRTLSEMGYRNVTVVEEQRLPDGWFPTCPYPNPENREALSLGLEYCKKISADLLIATDPDCDRVGAAVRDESGEYVLLTGNEMGILLFDYICSQKRKHQKMPADPVMVKTIVSTDMAAEIAADYGVRTVDLLTGFKFIGEYIGELEKQGAEDNFIFGFEESYGYLSGSYVRDKDGVGGSYLICEMLSYYRSKGITLIQKLQQLYDKYGYYLNTLYNFEFKGSVGLEKMKNTMEYLRNSVGIGDSVGKKRVKKVLDYICGIDGLPKSDVLKYMLDDNSSVVIRPSGTEPKLKVYISVAAESKEKAEDVEKEIAEEVSLFMEQ